MRPEFLIPVKLEEYPSNIKVRMDERQFLFLMAGLVFAALGTFIVIIDALIPGLVFIALGAFGILYTVAGLIQFSSSVKANKTNFFLHIREKVSTETGVKISNAQLAKMWIDGKTKIGGYEVYVQGRTGKLFSIGIY